MRKIDPSNKVCVYLDQFVVSNLIEEKTELWKEIKFLLEKAHSSRLLYCPLSPQHLLETAKKDIENAVIHHEYFVKLSDNYFYKNELLLTCQLISSLIRSNKFTLKTFLENTKLKRFEDAYSEINDLNLVLHESLSYKLSPQNELRKILNPKIDIKIEKTFLTVIKSLEVANFKERLKEYILKGTIMIRPDNYGKHNFPNWIDQILYILTTKHTFKESQFKQLLKELELNGFDRIPTLNTRFTLGAYLSVKNKQENTGDHIDFMRIANSLCSSDILFTDKQRKFEIQALGLDKLYKTQIFSGVEKDLLEFKSYLAAM